MMFALSYLGVLHRCAALCRTALCGQAAVRRLRYQNDVEDTDFGKRGGCWRRL